MAFKQYSTQTIASKGIIPSVIYAALNPDRAINPSWNFGRRVVVTFTSSGTWTCPTGVSSVEYLVVAGGGSSGSHSSYDQNFPGGGGAG